jgi:GT2 family glycosyltransferase
VEIAPAAPIGIAVSPTLLIPVHNRRELTLACLRHLEDTGDLRRYRALVIDSASADGTSDAVRAAFPSVELLRGPATWWWTAAIAAGMSHAFERGAPAVVWLNDDVRPAPPTLRALEKFAETHPDAIAAPACYDRDERVVGTAFRRRQIVNTWTQPVVNVDGVSGFCAWLPRTVWERAGVPDARPFPHYYGDTTYMLQAKRAGCTVALLTDVAARIVDGHPRAGTVREFRRRLACPRGAWRTTFAHEKSPFRLATQWHYLRLRYGHTLGSILAAARIARWQIEYLSTR